MKLFPPRRQWIRDGRREFHPTHLNRGPRVTREVTTIRTWVVVLKCAFARVLVAVVGIHFSLGLLLEVSIAFFRKCRRSSRTTTTTMNCTFSRRPSPASLNVSSTRCAHRLPEGGPGGGPAAPKSSALLSRERAATWVVCLSVASSRRSSKMQTPAKTCVRRVLAIAPWSLFVGDASCASRHLRAHPVLMTAASPSRTFVRRFKWSRTARAASSAGTS